MARRNLWFIGALGLLVFGGVALASGQAGAAAPPRKDEKTPEGEGGQADQKPGDPKEPDQPDANKPAPKRSAADDLLSEPMPQAPKFSWTLASVALMGEDTYNVEAERKARKIRLANQAGAKLVNAFQQLVYFIANLAYPGAGAALQAVFTGFSIIGETVITSQGGFQNLSQLTRRRLQLYGNVVVEAQTLPGVEVTTIRKFPVNRNAQPRYIDPGTVEHYRKLIKWYRANLELQRIIATPDEPIMPVPYISFLQTERLWPPPLEPIELSSSAARAEYARWPAVLNWIALHPIESFVTDMDTGTKALSILREEYSTKYPEYRELVSSLDLPADVAKVMSESGSIPRIGSALFPVKAGAVDAASGL
jgi:hypothetical protein